MAKKEMKYAEAVGEIESILRQLENGDLDVDELAERVKRVTYLIKLCKTKLQNTEESVNKILGEDLNPEEKG
ncbi:MAG TPA: exodeoxyribonuclease VII small subunit [Bacteroidales bacterium]|nr:exodeoxyribonuclease VII small subunit [Bacteroidales bacterium]